MHYRKPVVVIVDAYTSGKFLAPGFIANGYECVHVQSRPTVIPAYQPTYFNYNFIENIIFDHDITSVLDYLKKYQVLFIIPGAETGVLLADQLNALLLLPCGNSLTKSHARRDKFLMHSALASKGIRSIPQYCSHQLDELKKWSTQHLYPQVLKPLDSSGSHGVFICHDLKEIERAHANIIQNNTVFGDTVESVLIQQFISGQEFIVNTVSYEGHHQVTDIWEKHKVIDQGCPINLYSDLLSKKDPRFSILVQYVYQVLDALEIRFGAGHSELMLTSEGPILIETAARVAGSINPAAVNTALGHSQISKLLDAYLRPQKFLEQCQYPEQQYAVRHVFFRAEISGQVEQAVDFSKWYQHLSSLYSMAFHIKPGLQLIKTTTLANFPGYCYLVAQKPSQIVEDYQFIRQNEMNLYQSMLESSSCSV